MALGAANIWGKASKEASLGCALEGQGGHGALCLHSQIFQGAASCRTKPL